ncbi:AAA family ATPase [Salinigranum salinum]|uniref:AAA family ATPase n=1 Tax=Salinigranum salinum TaxID=1364937 RepID=UPI001260E6FD|nr:MoxR family ATPase [Salinigranum salinum]
MSQDPDVYQVPISEGDPPVMRENYRKTVIEGVDSAVIEKYFSGTVSEEISRIWGTRTDVTGLTGDWLLFADRETDEYIALGEIAESHILGVDSAEQFAEDIGWEYTTGDPYTTVIRLVGVYDIYKPADEFWNLMGYSGFPYDAFSRINFDKPNSNFYDEYESISNFIQHLRENSSTGDPSSALFGIKSQSRRRLCPPDESTSELAPYYWVNQSNNPEEIEEGFLQAPRTDFPNYDLAKLQEGDTVFNYQNGEIIAYSEVVSHPYIVTVDGEEKRRVDIEIHRFDSPLQFSDIFSYLWQEDVRLEKYYPINKAGINQQYLFNLSQEAGDYLLEQGQVEGSQASRLEGRLQLPHMDIGLPDNLYFHGGERARIRRQVNASLNAGKHIIFTGPPGTGKTKLAKHICEQVTESQGEIVDGYRFTTATAEWTTFDTIGGYVPNRSAEGDELVFQPRIFLDCFRKDGEIRNEWLVIDEINRSDIDKAFGQLFSVLSGDSVQLPYERDEPVEIASLDEETTHDRLRSIVTNQDIFPVTPSWRLLATMNTYDKTSLYELSYAFMRRFNFIHLGVPRLRRNGRVRTSLLDPNEDENYATVWLNADESLRGVLETTYEQVAVVWQKVNQHQTIGPSIVRDILGYLAATGPEVSEDPGPALTDAVVALVFPQLEGMAPQEQRSLVGSLTATEVQTETGTVDLTLEGEWLERKAEDFFDLPPRSDE